MTQADQPEAGRGRTALDQPDPSLLSLDGLFEQFPGPVLVIAHNGLVIGANGKAAALVQAFRSGVRLELSDAVESALAGRVSQINPLVIESGRRAQDLTHALDLLALPWADGTAALLIGRDVTLERSLRQALIESRELYKELVLIGNDFAWETDRQGRFTFAVPDTILGFAADQLLGRTADEVFRPGETLGNGPFSVERDGHEKDILCYDVDGREVRVSVTARTLFGPDGRWRGARGVGRVLREIDSSPPRELPLTGS